jgi:UPF0716 protein FxsA
MLPWMVLALLCLPAAELFACLWLAHEIGWWLLVWIAASTALGLFILKHWRAATAWALIDATRTGEVPLGRLFWVARSLLAAVFFIFPGPISDLIGLILILPWPGLPKPLPRAGDGIIEGEFRRVEPERTPLDRHPHQG